MLNAFKDLNYAGIIGLGLLSKQSSNSQNYTFMTKCICLFYYSNIISDVLILPAKLLE